MLPYLGRLVGVSDLATEIKLFRVELLEGGSQAFAGSQPGQFAFLSAFGRGEAPFGIASTARRGQPQNGGGRVLDFAVNRLGSVTTGLHELGEGDEVGVRGPMGTPFPMDAFKGKNLIVLGGGIGGAPLRPVIHTVLDNRADYGHLTILWAARHPSLLVFTEEYDGWRDSPDTTLYLTVDEPDADLGPPCRADHGSPRASGAVSRKRRHHHLWSADHDPLRGQDAREAGLCARAELCHARGADALRHREVRSMQSG